MITKHYLKFFFPVKKRLYQYIYLLHYFLVLLLLFLELFSCDIIIIPLQGRSQDFKPGGLEISKIFFFQIRIHIVLINYQPRQIPKNHCFLIY